MATLLTDLPGRTVLKFAGLRGLLQLPGWQTFVIFIYAMASCLDVNDTRNIVMIRRSSRQRRHRCHRLG